jgi:hypothetical protein
MAEYFPQGKKRMFPHKVVVPCARAAKMDAYYERQGTDIAELIEYVDGEEIGGRYRYGPIRPKPDKSSNFEVQFFFSNDRAALAFKIRFG